MSYLTGSLNMDIVMNELSEVSIGSWGVEGDCTVTWTDSEGNVTRMPQKWLELSL